MSDCQICLDPLSSDLIASQCGHVFHSICLHTAIQRKKECPVCRAKILPSKLIPLYFESPTSLTTSVTTNHEYSTPKATACSETNSLIMHQNHLTEKLENSAAQLEIMKLKVQGLEAEVNEALTGKDLIREEANLLKRKIQDCSFEKLRSDREAQRLRQQIKGFQQSNAIVKYINSCKLSQLVDTLRDPQKTIAALDKSCQYHRNLNSILMKDKAELKQDIAQMKQQLSSSGQRSKMSLALASAGPLKFTGKIKQRENKKGTKRILKLPILDSKNKNMKNDLAHKSIGILSGPKVARLGLASIGGNSFISKISSNTDLVQRTKDTRKLGQAKRKLC